MFTGLVGVDMSVGMKKAESKWVTGDCRRLHGSKDT